MSCLPNSSYTLLRSFPIKVRTSALNMKAEGTLVLDLVTAEGSLVAPLPETTSVAAAQSQ